MLPPGQDEDESRYGKERTFHDTLVETGAGRPAGRFYAINRSSWSFYKDLLISDAAHASGRGTCAILEYGSGSGGYSSLALAEAGYPSIGIDLSAASIRAAQERAAREYPGFPLEYRVMNAERLKFSDDAFDLVCGNGILHHLDLDRSCAEIARVLRPEGSAIFSEPLGHNPLINLYRRFTPAQRTDDEHPLRMSDLRLAKRHFAGVEAWYFHLFAIAATPFQTTRFFATLLGTLDRLDQSLLHRFAPSRKYAWLVVLRFTGPGKPGSTVLEWAGSR
jgi:SAM-dependent methyltransferase